MWDIAAGMRERDDDHAGLGEAQARWPPALGFWRTHDGRGGLADTFGIEQDRLRNERPLMTEEGRGG
jgi:hypothetical protein